MSELTLPKFADRVAELMPAIMKEFVRHQGKKFYKLKITMPQFFVMEYLHHKGMSKMSDIAKFINVTTAAVTGIVDRLVRDGYLVRQNDPDDRRIILVRLTAKGLKVVKTMLRDRKAITMKIFGAISQAERSAYLDILTSVRDALEGQA